MKRRAMAAVLRAATAAVTWALFAGCAGPRVPAPPPALPCASVADNADEDRLEELRSEHGGPLVLIGSEVFVCECGRRTRGAGEARRLGGDQEDRRVAGDQQDRHLGGDTDSRTRGGDAEPRRLGGDTEGRAAVGTTQQRSLGGQVQATQLTCVEADPGCGGFAVRGQVAGQLAVYAGDEVVPLSGQCVPAMYVAGASRTD